MGCPHKNERKMPLDQDMKMSCVFATIGISTYSSTPTSPSIAINVRSDGVYVAYYCGFFQEGAPLCA